MGWSVGFDPEWQRDVGWGVPAYCDHPDCNEEIDRGLSYVCGGQPLGGEEGCGLYFCAGHLHGVPGFCVRCQGRPWQPPFKPKPDHPDWTEHKATDSSWEEWRRESGK